MMFTHIDYKFFKMINYNVTATAVFCVIPKRTRTNLVGEHNRKLLVTYKADLYV